MPEQSSPEKTNNITIWEEIGGGRIVVDREAFTQFAVEMNRSLAELLERYPPAPRRAPQRPLAR